MRFGTQVLLVMAEHIAEQMQAKRWGSEGRPYAMSLLRMCYSSSDFEEDGHLNVKTSRELSPGIRVSIPLLRLCCTQVDL